MLPTDAQIEQAKREVDYGPSQDRHHEHPDCVRMAYAWLDAQQTRATPHQDHIALKHVIEKWAGRYVSQDDVIVAAHLHPRIRGSYPRFNLSKRMILPSFKRLDGIGQANMHPDYRERLREKDYFRRENETSEAA